MSAHPEVSPADRTVGQLVADTIRLYQRRFWPSLGIGILAASFWIGAGVLDEAARVVYALVAGPIILGAALAGAVRVATGGERGAARAVAAGAVALFPLAASRAVIIPGIYFVALAWFALTGLAVAAILVEGRPFRDSFARALSLARADFVHAFGTVAALAVITVVSVFALSVALAGFGEQSLTIAAILAFAVIAPLFFLGSALLYFDQKARLESGSPRRRRSDARLHHADEPDRAGRPDAEVEPGPPARGEP